MREIFAGKTVATRLNTISHARAHRDQREHVGGAIDDGRPAALKKWRSAPQHHRRGQKQFDPGLPAFRQQPGHARQHVTHRDHQQRSGQRQADPEAPRHVAQLGIVFFLRGDRARLQRHAANRAMPRPRPHNFRMHRAGVLHLRCRHSASRARAPYRSADTPRAWPIAPPDTSGKRRRPSAEVTAPDSRRRTLGRRRRSYADHVQSRAGRGRASR